MPAISVIIPVYNADRYLESAVASVQAQTFSDFEIIAVDDGSTDSSKAILERLATADRRIRVISRPNTGIVGALNDGLAAANGEIIARMDADDLCAPTRFERQLAFLKANPAILLAGSNVEFIDARGARLKSYIPPHDHATISHALLTGNSGALIHPAVIGPRRAWIDTGGYREEYKFVEDYDLYLRAARLGPLANLNEPLLRYRIHAQSTNYIRRDLQTSLLKQLCADARAHAGVSGDFNFIPTPAHPDVSSVHREWAWWALEGSERKTAIHYAWKAWRAQPLRRANLLCLFYILRATRRDPAAP